MLLLCFLVILDFLKVRGISFPVNEYNYLKEFYYRTNGLNWINNTNWNFENITLYNPCLQSWYGVYAYCGSYIGTGGIYLSENNLMGQLPPVLANFPYLFQFYTPFNY